MDTWFKINAQDEEKTVNVEILEEIGGWGISGRTFIDELKQVAGKNRINLLINSPGGSVIEGNFIYNELTKFENHITAEVTGMAASMASIIAMAADDIHIHENSYLMIHNPWTMAVGESSDLRKMADLMDNMKDSAIKAYQRHAKGLSAEKISELMDAETWLTGLEAVAMGFAELMLEPLEIAASVKEIPDAVKALVMAEATPETEEEEDASEPSDAEEESTVLPVEDEADTAPDGTADPEPEQEAEPEATDEPEEPEEPEEPADTIGTDAGTVDAKLAPDYVELFAKFEKQADTVKQLQSERDKAKAELTKALDEHAEAVDTLTKEIKDLTKEKDNQIASMNARLQKMAAPGFEVSDTEPATFRDAMDEHGYEEARKQFPELYSEFMNKKKK